MTDEEICRQYRMAKNKKQQITILMDCTGFTKEEIIEILVNGGEDVNYTKAAAKKKEEPRKEEPKKEERPRGLPESVMIALYAQLEVLENEIHAKEEQYKEIVEFIRKGGQQA